MVRNHNNGYIYAQSCMHPNSIITIHCSVACVHPLFNYSVDTSLLVLDYSEPALVGTMVSFSCSQPEEKLIGPNSIQCMEDGRWVPDPYKLISCKGISISYS